MPSAAFYFFSCSHCHTHTYTNTQRCSNQIRQSLVFLNTAAKVRYGYSVSLQPGSVSAYQPYHSHITKIDTQYVFEKRRHGGGSGVQSVCVWGPCVLLCIVKIVFLGHRVSTWLRWYTTTSTCVWHFMFTFVICGVVQLIRLLQENVKLFFKKCWFCIWLRCSQFEVPYTQFYKQGHQINLRGHEKVKKKFYSFAFSLMFRHFPWLKQFKDM